MRAEGVRFRTEVLLHLEIGDAVAQQSADVLLSPEIKGSISRACATAGRVRWR